MIEKSFITSVKCYLKSLDFKENDNDTIYYKYLGFGRMYVKFEPEIMIINFSSFDEEPINIKQNEALTYLYVVENGEFYMRMLLSNIIDKYLRFKLFNEKIE